MILLAIKAAPPLHRTGKTRGKIGKL